MFIQFDKQKIEILTICGILEDYKPSDNAIVINHKTQQLKEKIQRFMDETVNPSVKEIEDLISKENEKHMAPLEPVKE